MTEIVPVTWKATVALVKKWHRHLPDGLTGNRFACALAIDDEVCAVGTAGTPSIAWNEQRKIVITRVAVKPGTPVRENACSRIYARLCQAAEALGYREAWTYTLPGEPGTSLKAAGFDDMGMTAGGEWNRPSRARAKATRPEPKRRWRRVLGSKPWTKDLRGPEGTPGEGKRDG